MDSVQDNTKILTQISGQMKRYTDNLAVMEHTSGTIFPKKILLMYHILATKSVKKLPKNNTIPYRLIIIIICLFVYVVNLFNSTFQKRKYTVIP